MSELVWNVKYESWNERRIKDYNALSSDELIKKLKKKSVDRDDFADRLKHEMMYHYWSKCEWELIVKVEGDRVYLSALLFRPENPIVLDVTDDTSFDWRKFADYHIKRQCWGTEAKIDVYDQLQWRWDEFVDYCWNHRFKYERKK